MLRQVVLGLALLAQASAQSTTCIACVAIFGLLEQIAHNETGATPEATCKDLTLCSGACPVFKNWPVTAQPFPKWAPIPPRLKAGEGEPCEAWWVG